ncbi:hypothetical protein Leryth_024808 [Lithospermum erythrorhizon]|nr:hypothetical protein Leryth_024808 [Lithospermum erythrorhizon]
MVKSKSHQSRLIDGGNWLMVLGGLCSDSEVSCSSDSEDSSESFVRTEGSVDSLNLGLLSLICDDSKMVGVLGVDKALDGSFVRRSAANMLSEKRPVAAAVRSSSETLMFPSPLLKKWILYHEN